MGGSGFWGLGSFGLLGGILNLVITVGIIIAIVLLVIWMVRRLGQSGTGYSNPNSQSTEMTSPQEILRVRYARGELTREQYQEILADLD
ncbi:MAG: SHOCT domain-containing protein [Anaerolineales bacterium]|nr:MAG: SHOCT domain-containing protein [Anaerolineales bacterium]